MRRDVLLGPFRLDRPIARGGMGRVWRAVHVEQGVPVAIKVMAATYAGDPEYRDAFRAEVRAVAALDHPGIVMVLDHGEVDASAAGDELSAGSPWLAMELCRGGTLQDLRVAPDWTDLKAILLAILDALAHAHAREVVHRDLKPSNVLVATASDPRPGLKLSDFGIAHAMGDPEREDSLEGRIVGTPAFMAPEQVRGAWRDQGPWTDLYALGCLVYWLVGGQRPFEGRGAAAMVAHLESERLPLVPRAPVPPGFLAWVDGLMARRTWDRFQCAADAAAALAALGDAPEGERRPIAGDEERTRISLGESWRLVLPDPHEPSRPSVGQASRLPSVARPFPDTWKRALPSPPPLQLAGAGRSLYGLRPIPLVGRERERDLLWDALREVARTGRARAVVVRGAAGSGKSRLVRWLCRRSHELGAAVHGRAAFAPRFAPGEALHRMGSVFLRTTHLPRERVEERMRAWLAAHGVEDEDELAVATELLCPAPDGEAAVRLTRPAHFYTAIRQLMRRISQERALIVWMDDVQWGQHGLGLARLVLRTREEAPFPVLFAMTLREEALSARPEEEDGLRRLLELPGASEIHLGPLPARDHTRLVRGLLGLEATLAARVDERTRGNPLFAVQLVGEWVQRGLLEATPSGFALRRGASVELPGDVLAVWRGHLDRILSEFRDDARRYLEIAAVLGQEVDRDEWDQACDDPGGVFEGRLAGDRTLRAALVDRLLGERLAVGTIARWSFVHGMLRESLEQAAREAGRFAEHHIACATMLWARAASPRLAPAERLGSHLLAAGLPGRAIDPLLAGVEQRLVTTGAGPALALLETVEQAMREVGLVASDKRRGRVETLRARIARELGDPEGAVAHADRALADARAHRWAGVARYALHGKALVRLDQGRLDEAEELFGALHAAALAAGAAVHLGHAEAGLAEAARRRADFGTALDRVALAAEAYRQAGDRAGIADTLRLGGRCEEARGATAAALDLYERAREAYAGLGLSLRAAECTARVASLERARGNLAAAAAGYRRALSRYEALDSDRVLEVRLRLGLVLAEQGRPEACWNEVRGVRPRLSRLDHAHRLAAGLALQAVQLASRGHWPALPPLLEELAHAPATEAAAWGLRITGALARAGGRADLATRAIELAGAQWQLLGAPSETFDAHRAMMAP